MNLRRASLGEAAVHTSGCAAPRHAAPTAIDLFCGAGGLTLGLKQAGFSVLAAVDNDPLAIETYRQNHPEVITWCRDIRALAPMEVMQSVGFRPGDLDLLAGCPPCQGYSMMRTLNGSRTVDDDRNGLARDFLRFVKALWPKVVMMENVPGLATDAIMAEGLRQLEGLGYFTGFHLGDMTVSGGGSQVVRILDAAEYGVPQRRRRMLLLTGRFGAVPFAPADLTRATVWDTIGRLPAPGSGYDPLHNCTEKRSERIRGLIGKIPRDGGSRSSLGVDEQLACHRACTGFKDVYGRMSWGKVAPTITSGCTNPSKGRFLHPEQDRAITLREAALLQSFPADYSFSPQQGKQGAARLIGNAIPPEFARRQAVKIREYLQAEQSTAGDDLPPESQAVPERREVLENDKH